MKNSLKHCFFFSFIVMICCLPPHSGTPAYLDSFNQIMVYIKEGVTGTTIPDLEIRLDKPAEDDISIALSYSDANISGPGNVTIGKGASAAPITLTGNSAGINPSILTATYNSTVRIVLVRVYGDVDTREIATLLPVSQDISLNNTGTLTVRLNLPAPTGGITVGLGCTAGASVPANVNVSQDALEAVFLVTAGAAAADCIVTASYLLSNQNAVVHVTE